MNNPIVMNKYSIERVSRTITCYGDYEKKIKCTLHYVPMKFNF